MTPEDTGQADDPLNMNLKEDAARVHHETAGDVAVLVVENENVYPKQSKEIYSAIKGTILAATEPKVLIDLSQVEFVCSAFIGEIAMSVTNRPGMLEGLLSTRVQLPPASSVIMT